MEYDDVGFDATFEDDDRTLYDLEAVTAHEALLAWQAFTRETTFDTPDDDRVYGLAPFGYTQVDEQHDLVKVSNYHAALKELRDVALDDDSVEELGVKHWVGSVRGHLLRVDLTDDDLVARLSQLADEVAEYPVLDEEDLTEREDAELLDALTYYDDVEHKRAAAEVLAWLDEHTGQSYSYGDLPDEDEVRRAVVALGYATPDPERGETPLTSVEETALVF